MDGSSNALSALKAANTEARTPAETWINSLTMVSMAKSRVYSSGACCWNSCSSTAPSNNHSIVPRTITPKGMTWPCGTMAIGIWWYWGCANSLANASGFLGGAEDASLHTPASEKSG